VSDDPVFDCDDDCVALASTVPAALPVHRTETLIHKPLKPGPNAQSAATFLMLSVESFGPWANDAGAKHNVNAATTTTAIAATRVSRFMNLSSPSNCDAGG
jgi:hypothetical protein